MRYILSFLIIIISGSIHAQLSNDCVNAIIVCGNSNISTNVEGYGQQEVSGCSSSENNSIWLKLNIVQSGTLGFNLIPESSDIYVDYDFWIYGPNVTCATKGSPIRCSTTNPAAAGLSNNHTGMNGTATQFFEGPGELGISYVKWLDVVAGQSYYLVIDRPAGDGGFQLNWTGTAMAGQGAFTSPPTANSISPYKLCSTDGISAVFDLNSVKSAINSDLTSNTITFYNSYEDAFDGIVTPLPNSITNDTNPKTIFAKVKNNAGGCFSIVSFQLVVNKIPDATIAVNSNSICLGQNAIITFNGTPNAKIFYKINGGTEISATLNASGVFQINNPITTTTSYQLTKIVTLDSNNAILCSKDIDATQVVEVISASITSLSSNNAVCSGQNAVFSISGTPNATIAYKINNGTTINITLDSNGMATVTENNINANCTINLISISLNSCTFNLNNSNTIQVISTPVVNTLNSNTPICTNQNGVFNIQGTPNGLITYSLNGAQNQTVTTDNQGNAIITVSNPVSNLNLEIKSIKIQDCIQNLSMSSTISVLPLPIVSDFSALSPVCFEDDAVFSIIATPNTTITYLLNQTQQSTLAINASGTGSIVIPDVTATQNIKLISIANSNCSNNIDISKSIDVLPQLLVTSITSNSPICEGSNAIFDLEGSPNAILTYSFGNATPATIQIPSTGKVQLIFNNATSDVVLNITKIESNTCFKILSTSLTIEVDQSPSISNVIFEEKICKGSNALFKITGTPDAFLTYNYTNASNFITQFDPMGQATISLTNVINPIQLNFISLQKGGCKVALDKKYNLSIIDTPQPILKDGYLCLDASGNIIQDYFLDAGNFTGSFQFFWHKIESSDIVVGISSGPIYQVYSPGKYYVIARNIETGCYGTSNTVQVDSITSPSDIQYTVTNAFSSNPSINISIIGGTGDYLYQLNDGAFQNNPSFQNVHFGQNQIVVTNDKGCSTFSKNVNIIGHPKFFTPNGDGINDTWNVVGINQPNSIIQIFDRHGKFIKNIIPTETGWDGTYDGNPLPSTDYWFIIEYTENNLKKIYKSHFALKR